MGTNPTFVFENSYFKIEETTKNLNQVGRPRDSNPGPPECESRALPRSHLARYKFIIDNNGDIIKLHTSLQLIGRYFTKRYAIKLYNAFRLSVARNTAAGDGNNW